METKRDKSRVDEITQNQEGEGQRIITKNLCLHLHIKTGV